MKQALLDAYRRLPEAVRYSLRPVNALEESASFLPSGPRLALLEAVRAYRTIRAAAKRRADVALLEGVSRVDGAALRVVTDLSRDAEVYWKGLLFAAQPTRRVVGQVHGAGAVDQLEQRQIVEGSHFGEGPVLANGLRGGAGNVG